MSANPRILILGEATSSVDTVTESRLQHALTKPLKRRTRVVVAHRSSTVRHADLVLVLDHGLIVEPGNHRQLLAVGGRYARHVPAIREQHRAWRGIVADVADYGYSRKFPAWCNVLAQ